MEIAVAGLMNGRDFPAPRRPHGGNRHRRATMDSANSHPLTRKGKSIAILYVDVDPAKSVSSAHGMNEVD